MNSIKIYIEYEVQKTILQKLKELSDDIPKARGKADQVNLYVDADHVGNTVNAQATNRNSDFPMYGSYILVQ